MKKVVLALLVFGSLGCFAAEEGDIDAVKNCIEHWGKTPFKANPRFRVISSKVKVMGIGGDINDTKKTSEPELVLIKPSVTVMAKTALNLMNPNGWYCIKANVSVLGKSEINLNCKANLATSNDGTTVLGGKDEDAGGGVAVLGSIRVNKKCN